jgi:hypothetical protein
MYRLFGEWTCVSGESSPILYRLSPGTPPPHVKIETRFASVISSIEERRRDLSAFGTCGRFCSSIFRDSRGTECAHFLFQGVEPLQFRLNCRGALFAYSLRAGECLLGNPADFVQQLANLGF